MQPDTVQGVLKVLHARFEAAGIGSATLDARLLVQSGLGIAHEDVIARPHRTIAVTEFARVLSLARRRELREPISRILGCREFYGRDFVLSPEILDPRPATETLVEHALKIAAKRLANVPMPRLLDLGTGSGAIAVSLLAELPQWSGVATDISFDALKIARENAGRHGVLGRLGLVSTSWLDSLSERFDLIVCNPPYIPSASIANLEPEVRCHDPALALDGGPDGLSAYRVLARNARKYLKSHGFLCLEIGAGQGPTVEMIMAMGHMVAAEGELTPCLDLAGLPRVLTFTVSAESWDVTQKSVGNFAPTG